MAVRRIGFILTAALAVAAIPAATAQITSLREVQQILKDKGYYTGQVDNMEGPLTKRALTAFQTDQGLPVTGRPDQATLNRLNPAGISAADIAAANPGREAALREEARAAETEARAAEVESAAAEVEAENAEEQTKATELTAAQQAAEQEADTVAGAVREAGNEARAAVTGESTNAQGTAERTATTTAAAAPAAEPKTQPAAPADNVTGTIRDSGRTVTDHGKSALSESKSALGEAWAEIKRAFGK